MDRWMMDGWWMGGQIVVWVGWWVSVESGGWLMMNGCPDRWTNGEKEWSFVCWLYACLQHGVSQGRIMQWMDGQMSDWMHTEADRRVDEWTDRRTGKNELTDI